MAQAHDNLALTHKLVAYFIERGEAAFVPVRIARDYFNPLTDRGEVDPEEDRFWEEFGDYSGNRIIPLVVTAVDSGLLSGRFTSTSEKDGLVRIQAISVYGVTLAGYNFSKLNSQ